MKKLFLAILVAAAMLCGAPALAANCSAYPYTLTNGTTADANQVMANFNGILTCANANLAHNGANSDITSLSGLSTPLALNQGGTAATTAAGARTNLGLGTAATQNTGTSGATVPLLNTSVTWTGAQAINNSSAGAIVTGLNVTNLATWSTGQGEEIRILPSSAAGGAVLRSVANGAANNSDFELYTYNAGSASQALIVNPSGVVNFPFAPTFSDGSGTRANLGLGTAATQNTGTSGTAVPLLNGANTWSAIQTFSVAPVFTDAAGSRSALGLGTAATQNTGTSGANVPLLNGANTWSATQTVSAAASGSAVTALGLRNTAGTASSSVLIDFDVSGAGTGVRSAQIDAILDGAGNGTALYLRPGVNGVGATTAMQLNSNLSVTLNGYGAGTLVTDASGNVTAASAATERGNLGLGSIATQASSSVSITGGAISGLTSLANTGDTTLGDANADTTTVNGHLQSAGTAPTVSSCGTGASVGGNSNDNRGSFTAGTGTVTSCVLTFSRAWAVAPFCVISPFQTTPTIEAGLSSLGTTAVTFTFNPNGASTAFLYHCEG